MGQFLTFLVALAVLLVVVPLAGLVVTGSWRQAWQYAQAWGRTIALIVAVAAVGFLIVMQLMPTP